MAKPEGTEALLDPEAYRQDLRPLYAELRERAPICEIGDRIFAFSRHADVRAVLSDPGTWISSAGVTLPDHLQHGSEIGNVELDPDILLVVDPPRHTPYRRYTQHSRGLAAKTLNAQESAIRGVVDELLDRVDPDSEINAVPEVAAQVAIRAIADVLGLPAEDCEMFLDWTDREFADLEQPNPQHDARGEAWQYMTRALADRRARPREDLLTWLATGEHEGFSLGERSATAQAIDVMVAGNETTRQAIAGGLATLAAHPDQRDRLVGDPDLIPNATEEILRWVTPTPVFARTAQTSIELAGHRFEPGDVAILLLEAANLDERAWEHADRFDAARVPRPMHVSFGHGPHFCLGAPLARLEVRVVIERILDRFPRFAAAGRVRQRRSTVSQGYLDVPLRLSASPVVSAAAA